MNSLKKIMGWNIFGFGLFLFYNYGLLSLFGLYIFLPILIIWVIPCFYWIGRNIQQQNKLEKEISIIESKNI